MFSNKRGFTLIELLLVVILIGVLSAVIINVINREKQADTAKNSIVKSNLVKLGEALHNFREIEGYSPQDENGDGSIMDEAGVSSYVLNWPDDTPEGAVYTYRYIPGSPDGYVVDATRYNVGCLSYCSLDGAVFENEESCDLIENSCTNPPEPPPPPGPICGENGCEASDGETCENCPEDCGECPAPPDPECGDGACNGDETCLTCTTDCGSCDDWEEPMSNCPPGTVELARLDGIIVTKKYSGSYTEREYDVTLTKPSKITISGYGGEGHPEDCPDGPDCFACPDGGNCGVPSQKNEEFAVSIDGELIGEYLDSGLDPDDGYYPLPGEPWVTEDVYPAGTVTVKLETLHLGLNPIESVWYRFSVCEDE